jgi:hypothetical protein
MMSNNNLALVAAAFAAFVFIVPASQAAGKRARLTVKVDVEGSERVVGNGSDQASAKFREGYTIVTVVESTGELAQYNTKDPQYAQKMLGLSQNVHAKVNAAQGKAPVKKMTQAQIQAYVQKQQAACGADQACLMKLAYEAQDLMANMNTGGATAAGNPGAYTGDEPPRYLDYFGFDKCGASGSYYVDRATQGTYGDVQGAVPYTVVDKADYRSNATEAGLICSSTTLVVDSQDNSFFMDSLAALAPRGTSTKTEGGGKPQHSSGEAAMHGEYQTWVLEQLRHAPRTGTKQTSLKLAVGPSAALSSGKYSGQANITLAWKLEDL